MPNIESPVGLKLDQIILATDFKPTSEGAAVYARALAERFSSTTTVAHVIDLSFATRSEAAMAGWPIEEMRQDSAQKMAHALNEFISHSLNVRGSKIESFNPALAIVDLADEIDADLIVMGTHARHNPGKMIIGSCADGVIHQAKCPVIILGPKAPRRVNEKFNLKTIVLATDLRHDALPKVAKAFALAQANAAKVYICHVVEKGNQEAAETRTVPAALELALRDLLPDSMFERTPECIIEFGDAGKRILELAGNTGADLIVLGAQRGGSYFARWSKGVLSTVLADAECAVMTVCAE